MAIRSAGARTKGVKQLAVGIVALVTIFVCLPTARTRADDIGANKSELIKGLLPTVVNVSVRKEETSAATTAVAAGAAIPDPDPGTSVKSYVGSGFVIDPSGLIVTNFHVVEDAFEITVMFSDGSRLPGKMLSASRFADIAVLKVAADRPLPAAHWGNSDSLAVGDQVFAAGNPFGIGLSVSAGIVSGLNRDIQNSPYDDYIQTDATINHGNSGGPLFDMQGNVVGVDSAIISPTAGSAGIGFALPSNSARYVINQLQTYGWIRPGWIGVKLQQVTPDIAAAAGMKRPEGSIVSWILPGGPAEKSGLAIGDVILSFDGKTPSDERALLRDIARTQVGDHINLLIRRNGAERELMIVTAQWPRDQWDERDAPMSAHRPKIVIPSDLGLTLAPVAASKRASLGLENGLSGVLVAAVVNGSDSARRGVAQGDIILRVQNEQVATPAEVQTKIDAARAAKRDYVLMLLLPKAREVPGPKWVALQLDAAGG